MKTDNMTGLTDREVLESREKHGVNILTPPEKASVWSQFLEKFNDPLIKILLVALCLSVGIASYEAFGLGEGMHAFFEPIGILIAILLATVISFALELNANKKFEMLNQVNDDIPVTVMRNGNMTQVPRKDIVVGDIVMLETGNEVPADGTLLETVSLSINESTLTGEPVIKKTHIPEEFSKDATYPSNKAMRGTTVTDGHGVMRVEAVGDATEYGKVYVAAQIDNGVKTPLTLQFERLGRLVSYASYTIGALILIGRMLIYDYSVAFDAIHFIDYTLTTIMLAVTLVVVSVPEGLPMSVTLSLAFSMKKMMKENMLPRTLHACETMGATTVICTDKTGTLTQNQMRVYKFELTGDAAGTGNHYFSDIMAECIAANTTAELDMSNPSRVKPIGNPTEGALLLSLNDGGVDYKQVRNKAVLMDRLPFTTELKYMASLVKSGLSGKTVVYVKGAPEIILEMVAITEEQKQHTLEKLLSYQAKAMRTLAFAYAEVNAKDNVFADGKLAIGGLRFMGFAAISDPVRKEVPDAIRDCIGAGIQVKIVTGDTSATAKEIGRQVGLWEDSDDKNEDAMITGPQFGQTPDEEVKPRLSALKIMSRARPNDKDRLVRMLKARGEVVAVTGDGTNDAPALNAADVGLSMGDGTAVAKEASDMTILDSSFKSIAEAVMWGRSLYKNIQRFITFQMTINVSACLIVLVGAFLGTESPLTVTQILWVNLIMDTFAALALASLPPSKDVLKEKPRKLTDSIISPSMAASIFGVGILFTAGLLALLVYFQHADINSLTGGLPPFGAYDGLNDYEHSLYFTIFVMLQFWNMFNAKAFMTGKSAFKGLGSCTWFIAIAFIILLGQVMIVEFGGAMFNVTPLNGSDWIAIIAGTSIVLWIGEIVRLFSKK